MDPVPATTTHRWQLYRLLAEPARLRLLALCAQEELAIGELAELLGESQPNVSKHVAPLKRDRLLTVRKQGTRAFVRLADGAMNDAVVADAVRAGHALCESDGSLARIADVLRARDLAAREFFSRPRAASSVGALPLELPAYLTALAPLIANRSLAVDAGTGDGSLLDVLAPVFARVIAVDREEAQLARARARLAQRGYDNVELVRGELGDESVQGRVAELGGADAVFASRVLHHAPRPARALEALAALAKRSGVVVVIDYVTHEDEAMRAEQADLWLGFDPRELESMARGAGLEGVAVTHIPRARYEAARNAGAPDAHLDWHVMTGRKS